jgi:trehalose/maltose hydrolase-like predicted phosphorylase
MEPIPKGWLEVARSLSFLYNETDDYHPEFEGFDINSEPKRQIKQADVVLLGFPVMYKMEASTREKDLKVYEEITRENGPAMTWAMHTVGWLEVENEQRASELFNRSYSRYIREPFKVYLYLYQ